MGPVALMVGSGKMHTGVWWGNLKERDHLEGLGIDRYSTRVIFNWTLTRWDRRTLTGLICLRIRTSGGL